MTNEIEHLEESLSAPPSELLGHPDLAGIRKQGRRRRTGRRTLVGLGGVLAVSLVATAAYAGLPGTAKDDDRHSETSVATDPQVDSAPDRLRPIAQRALDEIPGATKVTPGLVVIPGPAAGPDPMGEKPLGPERFAGDSVPMDTHYYTGVTSYRADAFPDWLYQGVKTIEKGELGGDDGSYPVGSMEMGIAVDSGSVELACMRAWDWNADKPIDGPCRPAMVSDNGAERRYLWGLGTDEFMTPGSKMELFSDTNYATGSPTTLWVGGMDGTMVTRVEYIATDGTSIDAEVSTDALVPGETMFWAQIPGELAKVVAYDVAGEVVEDHPVQPCSTPVDCEVR